MLTHNDQMDLFRKISTKLKKDVLCWAFGGTAMMFYGYKDDTKDVDLLFENIEDREEFIRVLELMGFNETSSFNVYIKMRQRSKGKPVMMEKEGARLDLFSEKIFSTILSDGMKNDKFAVHDFKENKTLRINVVRKEHIVLLKAVTERDKDFNDIKLIVDMDKNFDWQYFVDEVLWQYRNGNDWAILDAEKMMKELKEYVFIPEKYFKMI